MALVLIILIIALDQVSKYLVKIHLKPIDYVPIIRDVFHLTYAENRGAAFGLFQGQRIMFIILSILIVIVLVYYFFRTPNSAVLLKLSFSLILSGALGNLIDRIRLGYVVDMLDFTLINFPIFNIADASLVIGSIIFMYSLLLTEKIESTLSRSRKSGIKI